MANNLTPLNHCSARLRAKLKLDEDEALARSFKVRVRKSDEQIPTKSKGGRWHLAPDFSIPGPFSERPVSPDGRVSFHFGWTVVSKSSSGKSVVADSRGRVSQTARPIGEHDAYVCREGAVMTIGPADFDRYAAREDAVELTTGQERIAFKSNISFCAEERAEFWRQVHASASVAGPDRLVLDATRGSRKEWLILAADERLPNEIRAAAGEIGAGRLKRKAEFPMSKVRSGELIALMRESLPGVDRKKGPVRFAAGRNGRTQYRLEAEFPDGLTASARFRIMERVAEKVESVGGMYTTTIHEPDEHNDLRNYHLHLVAYDRPAKLVDGVWDFTVREAVQGQTGRTRVKNKKRKIEISELVTGSRRGDFEAFLRLLRTEYATYCNEELIAAGQSRLFDARTYKEMGIDRRPTKPLGSRLAPLEAAGVPTKVGTSNAEIIWNHRLRQRLSKCEADKAHRAEQISKLQARAEEAPPSSQEQSRVANALASAVKAAAYLDAVEPDLALYEVTLEMARARPDKTIDTCSRILAKIDAGGGSASDRKNKDRISERLASAEAWLTELLAIDRDNQTIVSEQVRLVEEARGVILSTTSMQIGQVDREGNEGSLTALVSRPPATQVNSLAASEIANSAEEACPDAPSPEITAVETPVNRPDMTLETILTRIASERLIVLGPEYHGQVGYRVPGITRQELAYLTSPEIAETAQEALAAVAEKQIDRLRRAHHMYKALGQRDSSSYQLLVDYQDHPLVQKWMGWEPDEPEEAEDAGPVRSLWRRLGSKLSSALNASLEHATEGSKELLQGDDHPLAQTIEEPLPALATTPDSVPAHSRDEAVDRYAQFIRDCPSISFIDVDGEVQVDPDSAPDWRISVEAFQDARPVREAIAYRCARRQDHESALAKRRERIRNELRAGNLKVRQTGEHWLISGDDKWLAAAATAMQDHPDVAEAIEANVRARLATDQSTSREITGSEQAKSETPSATLTEYVRAVQPSGQTQVAQGGDYTLEQQNAFLERLRQRGVGG